MNLKLLGEKIKKYRKENNISQQDLATKLGISRATLSYYENNLIEPNIYFLYNLSLIMNHSIDTLISDSSNKKNNNYIESNTLINSKTEKEKIRKYKDKEELAYYLKETKKMLANVKKSYSDLETAKIRLDRTNKELSLAKRRVDRLYEELLKTNNRENRFNELTTKLDQITENLQIKFNNE